MNGNFKFICCPGWACNHDIESWYGVESHCVSHLEQMSLMGKEAEELKALVPSSDWGLVTWSMGSWFGLKLSEIWKDNPPQVWIALSPFLKMVGEGTLVEEPAFEALVRAFDHQPQKTLDHFQKRHQGKMSWCQVEKCLESDWEKLKESLKFLSTIYIYRFEKVQVPLYAYVGDRDKLVSEDMVKHFGECFAEFHFELLQDKSHALFYEEGVPEDRIKAILKSI